MQVWPIGQIDAAMQEQLQTMLTKNENKRKGEGTTH